jgi:hypothetical protein
VPARLRRLAQHALATTADHAPALTLAAVALVIVLLAAHVGRRLVVPAWTASLFISGACVGLALGAWLVARRRVGTIQSAPVERPAIGNMAVTLPAALRSPMPRWMRRARVRARTCSPPLWPVSSPKACSAVRLADPNQRPPPNADPASGE